MKLKLSFLFLLIQYSLLGQNGIEPMLCEGPLPNDLKQSISDIILKSKSNEFTTKNLLGIYDIFASGKVVYGNASWQSINTIGKRIIEKNHLDSNVRFYLLRSRFYNAFATDEGYIFATTALLANVQTEDEMAFVLCHELSHFLLGHNLKNQERTKQKLSDLRKKLKKTKKSDARLKSLDNFLKDFYSFSQANELQADSLGLELFIKAGYDPQKALVSISNLEHHQPLFHHEHYDPNSIEPGISFQHKKPLIDTCNIKNMLKREDRKKYFVELPNELEKMMVDSGYMTHPDWQIRLKLAEKILEGRKLTSVNPSFFNPQVELQSLSEMVLTEYKSGNYFHALSYLLILEKKHPNTKDISKMKGVLLSAIYLKTQDIDKIRLTDDFVLANSFLSEMFFHLIAFETFKIRQLALHYASSGNGSENVNRMCGHYILKILDTEDNLSDFETEDVMYFKGCGEIDTVTIRHPFMTEVKSSIEALERSETKALYRNYSLNRSDSLIHITTNEYPRKWNNSDRDSLILLSPNFMAIPSRKTKKYKNPLEKHGRKYFLHNEMLRHGKENNIYYNSISFDDKEHLSTEQYNQYFLISEMIDEYSESGNDNFKCPLSVLYSENLIQQTGCKKVQLVQMIHSNTPVSGIVLGLLDTYVIPFTFITTLDFSSYIRMMFANTTTINIVFNLETSSIEYISIIETGLKPDNSAVSSLSQKIISDTKYHLIKN
ncbi:MAG: M48 family metallopeptidase [Bacteroidia bacterium]|nr:M48 family metallopeptidase [Bacteroidia bacterium]